MCAGRAGAPRTIGGPSVQFPRSSTNVMGNRADYADLTQSKQELMLAKLAKRPQFGDASKKTLEMIQNRLETGKALGKTVAVGAVLTWITGSPEELAAQGGVDLEQVAGALNQIPNIIKSRIQ